MSSKLQITGLVLATLTFSGAALAQQGGGGGGGQGGDSGGGDSSVIALRLKDHERARMQTLATDNGCAGTVCTNRPGRPVIELVDNCGGGTFETVRDGSGRIIRRVCHFNN
jgi:hypothetical protein